MLINYSLITANDVSCALGLVSSEDITGVQIAQEMLDGKILFTKGELERLACCKNVPVDFLIENDISFMRYKNYEALLMEN